MSGRRVEKNNDNNNDDNNDDNNDNNNDKGRLHQEVDATDLCPFL